MTITCQLLRVKSFVWCWLSLNATMTEYDFRTITLCEGEGNGKDRACLRRAAAIVAGEPESVAGASCVCPTLNWIVPRINDAMTDAERSEHLSPFIYRILNTEGEVADYISRLAAAADFADDRFGVSDDTHAGMALTRARQGLHAAQSVVSSGHDTGFVVARTWFNIHVAVHHLSWCIVYAAPPQASPDRATWCRNCVELLNRMIEAGPHCPIEKNIERGTVTPSELADRLAPATA